MYATNVFFRKSLKDNAKYMASCITILLINVPYFISVTCIVLVKWILPGQISFHEVIFAWVPILTSGLNPIIILTRTREARESVKGTICRCVGLKYEVVKSYSETQYSLASKYERSVERGQTTTSTTLSDKNPATAVPPV